MNVIISSKGKLVIPLLEAVEAGNRVPCSSMPNGITMPVGVQLVGRPYDEELLLEVAIRLEEARGPFPVATLARESLAT